MKYVVVIETKDIGWEIGGEKGSATEALDPDNWERTTFTLVGQAFHVQTTAGAARIYAERQRQVNQERHTPRKDATFADCELLEAAACYLTCSYPGDNSVVGRVTWPWDRQGFKPTTPIRNLEKAGALLAAEIDRRLAAGEQ